jgi:hypothetical protein
MSPARANARGLVLFDLSLPGTTTPRLVAAAQMDLEGLEQNCQLNKLGRETIPFCVSPNYECAWTAGYRSDNGPVRW